MTRTAGLILLALVAMAPLAASRASELPDLSSETQTFSATAGVTYVIAVDGFNGASGNITLQVQQESEPLFLSGPVILPGGGFQFTLDGTPGFNYNIQASANLVDWLTIGTLTNSSGTIIFTDTNAPLYPNRSYRAFR